MLSIEPSFMGFENCMELNEVLWDEAIMYLQVCICETFITVCILSVQINIRSICSLSHFDTKEQLMFLKVKSHTMGHNVFMNS